MIAIGRGSSLSFGCPPFPQAWRMGGVFLLGQFACWAELHGERPGCRHDWLGVVTPGSSVFAVRTQVPLPRVQRLKRDGPSFPFPFIEFGICYSMGLSMSMSMCISACICVSIHACVHACVYQCRHTCMYACVCLHVYVCVHMDVHS